MIRSRIRSSRPASSLGIVGLHQSSQSPLDFTQFPLRLLEALQYPPGEAVRVMEAGKRLSELTSQLVPESAGQAGGYVLIQSDQPVIAQVIFGGLGPRGVTLFSAVPPTVIE